MFLLKFSMASMDMNTYIYAPKDDSKHRMHWKDLYTVDEAGTCLDPFCLLDIACNFCGLVLYVGLSV